MHSGRPAARTLAGHRKHVIAICYSPDGKTLASASEDTTICLWDAMTGELLRTITSEEAELRTLVFYPDSVTLLSGDRDGFAILWDTKTGKSKRKIKVSARAIKSIVLSKDARYAVVVTRDEDPVDDHVYIWDGALKGPISGIKEPPIASTGISFKPDGKMLALGSDYSTDNPARLWATETGKKTGGHSEYLQWERPPGAFTGRQSYGDQLEQRPAENRNEGPACQPLRFL